MYRKFSFWAAILCTALVWGTSFFYFPKWKNSGTEATISWDVSGYYMYLPATFIYGDLKKCEFRNTILKNYGPTPDFQQGFFHEKSGNYVMKYSSGQAIMYSPAFFIAHAYASINNDYPADGFSRPYQFAITLESLLISLLGIWLLRNILLRYFSDKITGLTLICIVFGSNYLDYSAINGAMTHNFLFTIYTLIIWRTIKFYEKVNVKNSLILGLLIGLAALTRPTEIIAILIPLFWNIKINSKASFRERLLFIKAHFKYVFLVGISIILVGSIQLFYWKYASDEWIVYSYDDQGFSWFKPHIWKAMFSHRSGWLMYSPIMFFALFGFIPLFRNKNEQTNTFQLWSASFIFCLTFLYIAFAWDEWWYGASLGQRAMVQSYPMFAFPMAAFIRWIAQKNWQKYIWISLALLFIYLNLWFTHQAHRGGMLHCGVMTQAYYWKVLGTYKKERNNLKLLDTNEEYTGKRNFVEQYPLSETPFSLNEKIQKSTVFTLKAHAIKDLNHFDWLRVYAEVYTEDKEWDKWRMTQLVVAFMDGENKVKKKFIRIQQLIDNGYKSTVYIDTEVPSKSYDHIEIWLDHAESKKSLKVLKIWAESYEED